MGPGRIYTDSEAMSLALEEARLGEGFVSPNPMVGCVILDSQGHLLSKGFHSAVGQDHAEVDALKKVKDLSLLKDAQVYVTLEPCAHEGRTPSCAKHLAQLPIRRVVYGLEDPNPLVSGKGAAILKDAGKRVERMTELSEELEELAEVFLMNMRHRRAWVTLKVASSLDGKMALDSGESQWITSEASREIVQWLRGVHDAVAVGAGTILKDNPTLDIRHPHFSEKSNRVVIVDPRGETISQLSDSKLYRAHQAQDIFIALDWEQREKFQDQELARECQRVASGALGHPQGWADARFGWNYLFPESLADGRLDLLDLSEKLFDRGICSILCEGGAKVFSSFLNQKAADRLVVFQNASVFGDGLNWGGGFRISGLNQRIRMKNLKVKQLGDDLMVNGRIQY